jgi:hypothetical protein
LRCVTAAPPLPGLSQHDIRTYHGFRAPKPGQNTHRTSRSQ